MMSATPLDVICGQPAVEVTVQANLCYANFWACRWSMSAALPHMKARHPGAFRQTRHSGQRRPVPVRKFARVQAWAEYAPADYAAPLAKVPLRRIGDCEADIGAAAVFLASDAAGYITGQTLWSTVGRPKPFEHDTAKRCGHRQPSIS